MSPSRSNNISAIWDLSDFSTSDKTNVMEIAFELPTSPTTARSIHAHFLYSTLVIQPITPLPQSVVLTANPDPVIIGETTTLTATV